MDAKELMIGDWVLISVWDCDPFPSKITSVNYNSYRGKDYVDGIDTEDDEDISMYSAQPIPLTPEILEKNGWKCAKGGTMMGVMHIADRYDLTIKNENNGTKWWIYVEDDGETEPRRWTIQVQGSFNILGSIGYVHELQHALRLAGIKKEIVL